MSEKLRYKITMKMDATIVDEHSKLKPITKIDINPQGDLLIFEGSKDDIKKQIEENLDHTIVMLDSWYYEEEGPLIKAEEINE